MTELYAVPQHQSSFADVAKELWSYLTDRGAAVNYEFVDMTVEVPRETGAELRACGLEAQRHPADHHDGAAVRRMTSSSAGSATTTAGQPLSVVADLRLETEGQRIQLVGDGQSLVLHTDHPLALFAAVNARPCRSAVSASQRPSRPCAGGRHAAPGRPAGGCARPRRRARQPGPRRRITMGPAADGQPRRRVRADARTCRQPWHGTPAASHRRGVVSDGRCRPRRVRRRARARTSCWGTPAR